MAKEKQFPDQAAMERHEKSVRCWLGERGVPPRKRHCAIARGLFCWPQLMRELCSEAGLEPPALWLLDIYTLNLICITQYGIAATRRLKYHRTLPSKQADGAAVRKGSADYGFTVSPTPWRAWLLFRFFKLFQLTSFPDWFFWF